MEMLAVWKFPLDITDQQWNEMPDGARLLSVQTQGGVPVVWALVDPEEPKVLRHFLIYGTGHSINAAEMERAVYVGTVQTHGGALVWHVFDWGSR